MGQRGKKGRLAHIIKICIKVKSHLRDFTAENMENKIDVSADDKTTLRDANTMLGDTLLFTNFTVL